MKITIEFDTLDKSGEQIHQEIALLHDLVDVVTSMGQQFDIEITQKLPETANTKPEQPWRPNIYGDGIRTEKPPYTTINNFARSTAKDAFGRVIDSLIDEA